MKKEDQDNYSRNKGFDLSVQDEIAAKYGLGPSDAGHQLKTVYQDFVKIKEASAGPKVTVTYGVQFDSMSNVETKSRSFDYVYEDKPYELTTSASVTTVSGASVVPPYIAFVRGSDNESSVATSSHSLSRSQSDNQDPRNEGYDYQAQKRMRVNLLTNKVYRYPDPPAKLCAAMTAVSKHKYYLKIERSLRPPHYVLICLCGKRAPLDGLGTLSGDVKAVEVIGRTLNQYYLRMDLAFIGTEVVNKLHNGDTIEDSFLKYCVQCNINKWERRKNCPIHTKMKN